MSLSGYIVVKYHKNVDGINENAAAGFAFPEGASETEDGFIRIHYINDEDFLYDDANGYFLNGEPTERITDLVNYLEGINKSNWGNAVSDETVLDSKDIRSGFDRVFVTNYDVSGETNNGVRAGIGSGDDLLMLRVLNFDPNKVIGPGLFTVSGDIIDGSLKEQRIDHSNLYNFAPEIQDGYLYINSGEIFLYGSKVTEIFPNYTASDDALLSGVPNDWAPMMIRVGDIEPLALGCSSGEITEHGYLQSDQFHNHYLDLWNNNISPASPFHNIEGLARVYVGPTEIIEREVSTTPISVNHYINSGVAHALQSSDIVITYEEEGQDKCILPDADLSPLTWEDGDRILAMQPFERPPHVVQAYISQRVIQPVLSTNIVSGDSNLVQLIANVRDEDGAPVSGAIVGFDLSLDLTDIAGDPLISVQSIEESVVTSPPSGLIVRSLEHVFAMTETHVGDAFDDFHVGVFSGETGTTDYAMPARAYIEDDDILALVRYVETDAFGSAHCPIRIHNFNDYTSENKVKIAVSGYPIVTNQLNFRILSARDSIDGYVEVPDTGHSVPNTIKTCQYLSPSGTPWVTLDGYPYGGEKMVKLYDVDAFSQAWAGEAGDPVLTPPAIDGTASELWYDGNGNAHAMFDSIPISGAYVCWERMCSHTTDFVGTTYVN